MVPLLSQAAGVGGALLTSTNHCSLKSAHPIPPLFSKRRRNFLNSRRLKPLTLASAADSSGGSAVKPTTSSSSSSTTDDAGPNSISFLGQENVPLEGVIQFEKPNSNSRLAKWGLVGALAGGDVAALLLFSAIGRFSHGFSVFDFETFKTADPFIAGWFLSAYFLGGYGEDGRGKKGFGNAVTAAAKSWSLGIPLGLIIRGATIGHIPPTNFMLVTLGTTAVLLIGWRALFFSIFPTDKGKKNDVYKRGSPFELFESSALAIGSLRLRVGCLIVQAVMIYIYVSLTLFFICCFLIEVSFEFDAVAHIIGEKVVILGIKIV